MSRLLFLTILSVWFLCSTVEAEVIVDEPLSFGTFAIINNSSVSTISISTNDRASRTRDIQILYIGQAARLRLVNYPPFTRLFISPVLPQQSTVFVGTTEQFTLSQVDMPDSIITDSLGEASLRVGGTLETSGNGGSYIDTTYNLTLMLTINY
ncbi:MAG: DUF4402 domain-containing protein [Paraglaciecola polaris]|uniref:DUF4402 domain-containing protein n=1 Tax=Paraglaciecola polaris TaxID=222814 RepID=UPI003001A759|tara:strand:+ start:405 stop:863 length:459 start_codon:yes stop_codon:yes gene_type:complete